METSKIAYEYVWIVEEGHGAKRFKGSIVNKFQKICKLSNFNSLENVKQYKKTYRNKFKNEYGSF